MTTPWEEKQILQDIVDGLNSAIHEEGWDYHDLDPIKFNKLLYLAVDEFEVPVTYRWYKYGSDFTPHGFDVETGIQPTALEELPSPTVARIEEGVADFEGELPSPESVKSFYQTEVDDIDRLFEDDTKEYLQTFYQNYAPENLQDLYTACAIFQKSADEIGRSENPCRMARVGYDTVYNELKALNREVLFNPLADDVRDQYRQYSELLKDVLVTIQDLDSEFSRFQDDTLVEVIKFFYDKAWKIVALKIASENSYGSNNLDWKETALGRLKTLDSHYEDELTALNRRAERADLVADELLTYTEPMVHSSNFNSKSTLNDRAASEWEGTSLEANRHF